MTQIDERLFDDVETLVPQLAIWCAAQLRLALRSRELAVVALAGGRTPHSLYRALGEIDLPWSRLIVALTDERWVDAAHPQSNEGMIRRELMSGPASAGSLVGMKTDAPGAAAGAIEAEKRYAALPRFDLIVLGMGADGHVASLFPGMPIPSQGGANLVMAAEATGQGNAGPERVSLTPAALLGCRQLALYFTGVDKLAVYRDVLEGRVTLPVGTILHQSLVPVSVWYSD